jgi:glycosyltransferase involved in cell wall biosynthesis
MLGVHSSSKQKGGISTVVDVYRQGGLFDRWPIHYIGTMASGSNTKKLFVFLQALGEFMRLLITGRIALVHAHTASRASFWRKSVFMLLARLFGVPVILHLHGGEFEKFYDRECSSLRRRAIRHVLGRVNRVVVLSARWHSVMSRIAPQARVLTLVNPVHVPVVAFNALEREACSLLFLGRFNAQKGIFDLLEAVAELRTRFPAIKLRCCGDGDAASVVKRAGELQLTDNVEMLGWVSGASKSGELARATIYVLPSYAEGLPMGVLEAMAVGLPVIATRVGGIPDAIADGVDGLLIEAGDVNGLSQCIAALLADSPLRTRIAGAARHKALELFSTERVLAQLEELYRSLGAQPQRIENHGLAPTGLTPRGST